MKKLLLFLLVLSILSGCGLNKEKIEDLQDKLNEDEELATYFQNNFLLTVTDKKKSKLEDGTNVNHYIISSDGTREFFLMEKAERVKLIERLIKVIDNSYTDNYIECGKNNYCTIDQLIISDRGASWESKDIDSYLVEFEEQGMGTYEMFFTYYDESGNFQSELVSSVEGYENSEEMDDTNKELTIDQVMKNLTADSGIPNQFRGTSSEKMIQDEIKRLKTVENKAVDSHNRWTEKDSQGELTYEEKRRSDELILSKKENKYSPQIGMTDYEVRDSTWGDPKNISKTTTQYGVTEQWIYSNNRFLYFEDGYLTSIQE